MKVKYIKDIDLPLSLTLNKIYECIGEENGWYRIIDDSEEDYLFPKDIFEIVEK